MKCFSQLQFILSSIKDNFIQFLLYVISFHIRNTMFHGVYFLVYIVELDHDFYTKSVQLRKINCTNVHRYIYYVILHTTRKCKK